MKEVKIRLPEKYYKQLRRMAERSKRSVTKQVEYYVEQGIEAQQPQPAAVRGE